MPTPAELDLAYARALELLRAPGRDGPPSIVDVLLADLRLPDTPLVHYTPTKNGPVGPSDE